MLPLLLPLAVAHLFDLGTFMAMVSAEGIKAEFNPLVAAIASELGLGGLVVGKLALVVYVAAAVVVISTSRPRLAAGLLLAGTAAGLLAGATNLASI
jgi:hypothetical protein